ncbi:CDP-alcohol phosphatidyltransferase [Kiloniella spongiae]|uniref:CDP-alcohol phosphatidyltransferase n=1 Tax=Kiloniella spongiae TaxID=1489064 RepID=A0A0H2MHQ2_9PROT|nr:CDP-alcohol phosphatidyltransferase family protein [Kiloniella spongiae]KLN60272.1 CDP-alcohol phosphatidyltransferase [Kiloniella spongiae]
MFDAWVRTKIDPPLDKIGEVLSGSGLGANQITWIGFTGGIMVIPALATQSYYLAIAAIVFNRLCDGLDGAVARKQGITDLGGYLDITLDFIFYSAVVFGFALSVPDENGLAAAFLIFSFMGTGASFLSFAIVAAKKNISTDIRGKKSIYYLGGLTEGTETILLFLALCLWPDKFSLMAWVFGTLCWLTTGFRIHAALSLFED